MESENNLKFPQVEAVRKTSRNEEIQTNRRFSFAGLFGRRASKDFGNDSFQKNTIDAIPKFENYREINAFQRPTIADLHEEFGKKVLFTLPEDEGRKDSIKFGWIKGVLVRCLLNIWGVMLFLRLSWVVAQAGIYQAMLIIIMSTVVTVLTTLSMAAVSTNGEIKGGGIYYIISRTIGPEWGGSIGVVFSFANAGMAALNIVGFAEAVQDLMKEYSLQIIDGDKHDLRVVGTITIIVLQAIIVIGMEWEAKAQLGLLVILLIAMVDFVAGAFYGPLTTQNIANGWVGLNATVFKNNWGPSYKFSEGSEQNFFTIFAVFFPSVAGIQAGVSISGDLKDPSSAIPKGTLFAIFITSASYIFFGLLTGAGVLREATGNLTDVGSTFPNSSWEFANCFEKSCKYGSYNDNQVMSLMALSPLVIYLGCFASCLSSALSCMVSGPKTFQVLCQDKVYPYLSKFGVGYGKTNDPLWSYGLGFIIALVFIIIADLNAIAPAISNFFMAAYALLNFSAFHAETVKPLGWRPTWKYYNRWVCLFGAVACVVVMFFMDYPSALACMICVVPLYAGVLYRKPDLNWGTSLQEQNYKDALSSVQTLAGQADHVKNYHPQILCLSGLPSKRPGLVDFANLITKNQSLLICGNIQFDPLTHLSRQQLMSIAYDWFKSHYIRSFYSIVDNTSFNEGVLSLVKVAGVGKLVPNIVLMGYKNNWQTCNRNYLSDYFNAIHDALTSNMAIAILKVPGGLNIENKLISSAADNAAFEGDNNLDSIKKCDDPINGNLINEVSIFKTKQGKGTIDVWWLYDDGGLTLLLPYIINQRKNFSQLNLRVFTLADKKDELQNDFLIMSQLLSKFRIDYSDLIIVPDITNRAQTDTQLFFKSLVKDFRDGSDSGITEDQLVEQKDKINKHLRLRELLMEHSSQAKMIFMTLPVPRKGTVCAPLYMAWLECLTHGMPPFVLVRGNQTSVLTFYS